MFSFRYLLCLTSSITRNELRLFSPCPAPGGSGQTFDVTGVAGRIYSLIADTTLFINAKYETAFTTGMFIDPLTGRVFNMHPRGTWMTQVGIVMHDLALHISVNPREETEECRLKPKDCLTHGSVTINRAESVYLVGGVQLTENAHVRLSNKKSFSTVAASLDQLDIQIDIVPPPKVISVVVCLEPARFPLPVHFKWQWPQGSVVTGTRKPLHMLLFFVTSSGVGY